MTSTKWRTEKVYLPRGEVMPFVFWLRKDMQRLNPDLDFEIGGSWRRGSDRIGDLDIMVVTESGTFDGARLPPNFKMEQGGPNKIMGTLYLDKPLEEGGKQRVEMHADFWACTPAARGAMLLFITGPKALNIEMRRFASVFGWLLNEKGLFDHEGKQLDNGTEEDIFKKLYAYQSDKWLLDPGQREQYADFKPPNTARVRTWMEPSDSGGDPYEVTCTGEGRQSSWKCKCKAFQYSREIPACCKHIKRVKVRLAKEGEDVG